jgi:hypothetical protein
MRYTSLIKKEEHNHDNDDSNGMIQMTAVNSWLDMDHVNTILFHEDDDDYDYSDDDVDSNCGNHLGGDVSNGTTEHTKHASRLYYTE